MLCAAECTSVPTEDWMKAHTLRAKTLIAIGKYDEAIQILKRQISVIPPLPIPGLSYFKDGEIVEEEEENKDPFAVSKDADSESDENFVIEDGFKFTIGKTSQPSQRKRRVRLEHQSISFKAMKSGQKGNINDSLRFSFTAMAPKVSLHTHSKSNVNALMEPLEVPEEIHYEIENFSVSTNVDFLYQIGKICAESGTKTKEGIRSLNDFCLILDYFQQDMDPKIYLKMKTQARFYIGV